jgi:outer membrane protein TolC
VVVFEEWLARALAEHPALVETEAELAGRRLRAENRIVWEDPELRIGTDYRPGTGDQSTVTLRFPIPHLLEERSLAKMAHAHSELAQAERNAALRIAREDLGLVYLEATTTRRIADLAGERLRAMAAEVDRAQEMLNQRALTHPELLRSKSQYARALVDLTEWERAADAAEQLVREYGCDGIPAEADIRLQPARIDVEGSPPGAAELHRTIVQSDSELVARLAEVRVAGAAVAAERARRLPFPTFIEGSWAQDNGSNRDEWEARAGISIPLFTWVRGTDPRSEAEIIVATAGVEIRRHELARLASRVRHRFESARQRLSRLEESVSPLIAELDAVLADASPETDPDTRQDFVDDRFRLRRELYSATLELYRATWILHTLAWDWEAQ